MVDYVLLCAESPSRQTTDFGGNERKEGARTDDDFRPPENPDAIGD